MLFLNILYAVLLACTTWPVSGRFTGGKPPQLIHSQRLLQDIVTWDQHSLMIRGERIMIFSGEFHPFRLPVPDLWLDVFQKVKALGFSAVSFYTDWALHEGKQGDFTAQGVFGYDQFFQAASDAGMYLIARPGPYINAEVSGGGFPGWLQRFNASERTINYVQYTENYMTNIGKILAKAQITNGGPIILVQPENEYTFPIPGVKFPDKVYFQTVENQLRKAGMVVPLISNDAAPRGLFAPGTGEGAVDIYGHDSYPLGFDCANPYTWPDGALPTNFLSLHRQQSPSTPYTITEFQGGSFDPWGGQGFLKCSSLLNQEFERVFFKNNYAAGITIFNVYMIYGGTNAFNVGHPGGYTSYDYGAAITEARLVSREKYSEAKLEANFLKVSPAYLTASAEQTTNGTYVNTKAIATSRLTSKLSNGKTTAFYVVRQARYNSLSSQNYRLQVSTSAGEFDIPQYSKTLTINGRDSKIHVTDYDLGGVNLIYSTAEIFTWRKYADKTVLVLYGGAGEQHEMALEGSSGCDIVEGDSATITKSKGVSTVNWTVNAPRKVVRYGKGLYVYLLDRNEAYNYWVLDIPGPAPVSKYTSPSAKSVIVRAGYLLRTASYHGNTLALTGDVNATTTIEVIGGAPSKDPSLTFNGKRIPTIVVGDVMVARVTYNKPKFALPSLKGLHWKYIDSLPEIQPTYDDSGFVAANHPTSNNTARNLTTPTSLYASDYGFHVGAIITRGHFIATGSEKTLDLETWGGNATATSTYLNDQLIAGSPGTKSNTTSQHITLPPLTASKSYILTVVVDNMGLDEDFQVGSDMNKFPRGIVSYALSSRPASAISWRISGNLGGESYRDRVRGPLNEGGLYAERQGYHLPSPPSSRWSSRSPLTGISKPGIGFFSASFDLDMPAGYDIPLAFRFKQTPGANYRVNLYVNGWQFGKFVNNVGPQTVFPVPEGILNYHGRNWVGVSLWGFDKGGNRIEGLDLVDLAQVQTGYGRVKVVDSPAWRKRSGAY